MEEELYVGAEEEDEEVEEDEEDEDEVELFPLFPLLPLSLITSHRDNGWNILFPMQLSPVNFFVILIGSQLRMLDKWVRSVVPSGTSRVPVIHYNVIEKH